MPDSSRYLSRFYSISNSDRVRVGTTERSRIGSSGGRSSSSTEPLRAYNWRVIIPEFPVLSSDEVEDVSIPTFEFSQKEIDAESSQIFFPESTTVGDVVINYQENEEGSISRGYHEWRRQVQNENGTYNYLSQYGKTIILHSLKADGTVGMTYKCLKCWPKSMPPLDFTYGESRAVTASITFATNSVILE